MNKDKMDIKARLFFILLAILPLSVGCMFFIPGVYFLKTFIESIFIRHKPIDYISVFLIIFLLSIGSILLLLALKFVRGNVENQSISSPVLAFASLFFIAMATCAVVLGLVLHLMPVDAILFKVISGGYLFGGYGLWFALHKKKHTPNQAIER